MALRFLTEIRSLYALLPRRRIEMSSALAPPSSDVNVFRSVDAGSWRAIPTFRKRPSARLIVVESSLSTPPSGSGAGAQAVVVVVATVAWVGDAVVAVFAGGTVVVGATVAMVGPETAVPGAAQAALLFGARIVIFAPRPRTMSRPTIMNSFALLFLGASPSPFSFFAIGLNSLVGDYWVRTG